MQLKRFSYVYFFYFCALGAIVPYWGLYLEYLGFDAIQIGEIMALVVLAKVVTPNIWATLIDYKKHWSSRLMSGLLFCALLFYSLLFFVTQYQWVSLATLGYFVCWNACLPQIEAATMSALDTEKSKYGAIRLWGSVGFIVSVGLIGPMIECFGSEAILGWGFLCLCALFIITLRLPQMSTPASFKALGKVTSELPVQKIKHKILFLWLFFCFCMQLSHAPFYTFFSIYLQQAGYSFVAISGLWVLGVVCEIGVFLFSAKLLARRSLFSLLMVSFWIAALRWYVLAQGVEYLALIAFSQVLHAITYGVCHIVMIRLIDSIFPVKYQVRGQALYSSLTFGLGGALGSFLSGYIWQAYGANTVFLWSSYLMFGVALLSLLACQFKLFCTQSIYR